MATVIQYPWFSIVSGDELEQGDILENCPVFLPPEDLTLKADAKLSDAKFRWNDRDLIIMSQSCDICNQTKLSIYVLDVTSLLIRWDLVYKKTGQDLD